MQQFHQQTGSYIKNIKTARQIEGVFLPQSRARRIAQRLAKRGKKQIEVVDVSEPSRPDLSSYLISDEYRRDDMPDMAKNGHTSRQLSAAGVPVYQYSRLTLSNRTDFIQTQKNLQNLFTPVWERLDFAIERGNVWLERLHARIRNGLVTLSARTSEVMDKLYFRGAALWEGLRNRRRAKTYRIGLPRGMRTRFKHVKAWTLATPALLLLLALSIFSNPKNRPSTPAPITANGESSNLGVTGATDERTDSGGQESAGDAQNTRDTSTAAGNTTVQPSPGTQAGAGSAPAGDTDAPNAPNPAVGGFGGGGDNTDEPATETEPSPPAEPTMTDPLLNTLEDTTDTVTQTLESTVDDVPLLQ